MGTPGEPEKPPTAPLLRLLRTLGVDRAVFFSLLLRLATARWLDQRGADHAVLHR